MENVHYQRPALSYCYLFAYSIIQPQGTVWRHIELKYSLRDIPRPAGCGISPLKFEMAPWTQHQGAIPALKLSCSKHDIVKKPPYCVKMAPLNLSL